MGSRAIHHAGGNISFNGRTSYHSDVFRTLERCRYHLLRNVIPILLIVVGTSWITLLLTEQIYTAKLAWEERSSVATLKIQQGAAINTQEAGKAQSL
ncbi:hypothetical protein [Desulfuromonas sp. TF]|uniref:hypothetical protein n=1 Tax=Desulfuromonas sp. TF TaxID=1232410 RepID=UPI0004829381|nr:hypothetical protein [Desulfuromonas sp. TF]